MEGDQTNDHGSEAEEGKTTTAFPATNVRLIMRRALRQYPRARINGDARDAVDRCVAEFAAVVTTVAAEVCQEQKKATLNGDDLITAMQRLGYGHYAGPLAVYLCRYRESEGIVGRGRQHRQRPPALRGAHQQAPAADVATLEMPPPPPPPPPSGFALGQPPCEVTELDLHAAPAAAVATAEMLPPPSPSSFALGLPPCDVTELGLDTDVYAVWSRAAAASTSRMPTDRDDDDE